MKQAAFGGSRVSVCVPLVIMLLLAWSLAVPGVPTAAAQAKAERLIFGSAGFSESNRFWTIARPEHLQFDPFLETLLEVDSQTGDYVPRLAEKWQASPDMKEWTFFLRRGVPFHFGYGEFSAKDVVHSHSLMLRDDATATLAGFWRMVDEIQVIDDYQVVFRMKRPAVTMPYAVSRAGDLRMVSKAQWDKEGLEGFDKRPAGTGSYQYVDRRPGESISFERVDNHWNGEKPDFKELHIRIVREEATRLAMLLGGEAHVVDLPRELHQEALNRGMKVFSSKFPVDWMSVYIGGQYYLPGDPKFKPDVPWTNKLVRQAMNVAINRKELNDAIFAGKGSPVYVTGWLPLSEGWNPAWQERFNDLYGYSPDKAKALLKEAGYRPGTLRTKIVAFVDPGESEGPQVAEALSLYFTDVGIEAEIEVLDWAKVRDMFRSKEMHCCIYPNIITWRPSEEWIRTSYYSKGSGHNYEHPFVEERYLALTKTVDSQERQRLAREIGDHLFENFADMPLFWLHNEVMANPEVVADWTYPGIGAGRSTHFHLVKTVK